MSEATTSSRPAPENVNDAGAEADLQPHTDLKSTSNDAAKQPRDPASIPTYPSRNVGLFEFPTVPATFAQKHPPRSTFSAPSMASSLSPRSALSSPQLAALGDITPLPSPLMGSDSPGLWGRARANSGNRPISQGSIEARMGGNAIWRDGPLSRSSSKIKKPYGLVPSAAESQTAQEQATKEGNAKRHSRNRSISDFVPEALHNVRARNVTISSTPPQGLDSVTSSETQLHREKYLAEQRGLHTSSAPDVTSTLPSPPPSNKSATEDDEEEEKVPIDDKAEYMMVRCGKDHTKKLFRPIRVLGQGTFSKVLLATNQRTPPRQPLEESKLNPKKLVAIKIVEHGPAGGADQERVETGLKREIEIMKSVSHPSLVHLKAFEQEQMRTLLVLTYCPGCDLFDLASEHRSLLSPSLIQRIFAELVSAVLYLHDNYIVHRDIKLENVLINIPQPSLPSIPSYASYSSPLITLTDLGLSRRIPPPPASPLLTTRCGSEDYAAPEILLGQPYDGRATDAWALGVLLYALMEGRLPFDPVPGARGGANGRASHRIARAEWVWVGYGDEDGEWDGGRKGAGEMRGAAEVVEGLLRKVRMGRWSVGQVVEVEWVRGGIQVEGGLKAGEEMGEVGIERVETL
ncbi:kinase-like protein [Viridothelium virens]|uniref:Kinase-like protein n=1 Tax=Viridothelium virens TaxID=1048519 RepID=A0A6A6H6H4_VIRVR|nr:kinase-like protein [Viridothelium virens]